MKQTEMELTRTEVSVKVSSGQLNPLDVQNRAYAMMIDVARYPEYMPSVNTLEIQARRDNQLTTRWDADIDGAPIQWVQTIWCRDAIREMSFEAIEGDFDVFRGHWVVTEEDGQVYLKLAVEYRLGIPVIEEVLGPILREKVKANCESMLEAIVAQL